ncbi:MAG: hypothetical protein NTW19_01560 [Planctomycetota bacterium]|nr:hypothetical protein [Planctomycetota bacterium]
MGTRIHVYYSHCLPRPDDAAATISHLESALPHCLAVRDYWESHGGGEPSIERWIAEPPNPRIPLERQYEGPGKLWLRVTPAAAMLFTGARWRGFLMIEPLRRVHLAAFRAIGEALGSTSFAIWDSMCDEASTAFFEGGTQADCVAAVRAAQGPPQPSVEAIAPAIVKQAERSVPSVWFVEECGKPT